MKKLVQEANVILQHADAGFMLDEEVQRLKLEDAIDDTKLRLAKQSLEIIKVAFPL